MTYRLIALDMDGTLLNDHHEISPQTAQSIKQVAAQGVEIVFCTGRTPINSIPYMEQLGLHEDGYVIVHNGAATVHAGTREIVHQFPLAAQGLDPYIQYCKQHDIHFDINTAFGLYVDSIDTLQADAGKMYDNFLMTPKVLPPWSEFTEPVLKLSAFATIDQLDQAYAEWTTWNPEFNMLRSGEFFIDLMHPQSSKGSSLQALAESKGIGSSEVIAIGNYFNDLSMITYAGLGVAMDNSPAEVKAAADEVTLSNNEDGIHHILVKHGLISV